MKASKYPIMLGFLWVLAMGSLISVHFWLKKKPTIRRDTSIIEAYIKGLDQSLRTQIGRYEDAALVTEDGRIRLIGRDFELETDELARADIINSKNIDIRIEDPLALERRIMASEVFKKLNNAEKVCLADGYGAILFRNGSYQFVVIRSVYERYIKIYGTGCSNCGESK
jgi:hypothetical protein